MKLEFTICQAFSFLDMGATIIHLLDLMCKNKIIIIR
jgi:hypothetical protein